MVKFLVLLQPDKNGWPSTFQLHCDRIIRISVTFTLTEIQHFLIIVCSITLIYRGYLVMFSVYVVIIIEKCPWLSLASQLHVFGW